jgi:hypothetical protein
VKNGITSKQPTKIKKMKIKTRQLKQFNSIAGSMRQNNILPILSYIKFEDGKITKNNLESFVTMEADFEGSVLIDEKILMSFVESIDAEEIDVTVNGTKVTLSVGKEKDNSPTEAVGNFPVNPAPDGEEIEISQEVLKAVKIASNFTADNENIPFTSCVFIGKGLVAATTRFIAYTEIVDEALPEIIIEKSALAVIKNFNNASFSQNESYQFFNNHNFTFGFIKKDTKFVDMKMFSKMPEGNIVKMDKTILVKFCDMVNSRCVGRVVIANINADKVSMIDVDYGNEAEKQLPAPLPDFSFNPLFMGKLLKSLPDTELDFTKEGKRIFITGKSGFVSLIMDMVPSNN